MSHTRRFGGRIQPHDFQLEKLTHFWAYARPSTNAPISALLKTADDIETRNDRYQHLAAPVFNVNGNWYLIGVRSPGGQMEKAWVTTMNGNAFSWLDSVILVADNSCYVTDGWDQKIWAAPSANAKFRKLAKLGTKDFTVTDSNWNGDELWLQVEFTERVNCDWEELPPVLAKGWIRAYSAAEEMQVWFHTASQLLISIDIIKFCEMKVSFTPMVSLEEFGRFSTRSRSFNAFDIQQTPGMHDLDFDSLQNHQVFCASDLDPQVLMMVGPD